MEVKQEMELDVLNALQSAVEEERERLTLEGKTSIKIFIKQEIDTENYDCVSSSPGFGEEVDQNIPNIGNVNAKQEVEEITVPRINEDEHEIERSTDKGNILIKQEPEEIPVPDTNEDVVLTDQLTNEVCMKQEVEEIIVPHAKEIGERTDQSVNKDTESSSSSTRVVTSSVSLSEGKAREPQTVPCSVKLVKIRPSSKKLVLINSSRYYNLTRQDSSSYRIDKIKVFGKRKKKRSKVNIKQKSAEEIPAPHTNEDEDKTEQSTDKDKELEKDQDMIYRTTSNGKKPYRCMHCGERFRYEKTRARHLRTHTGETWYQCSYCGKKFAHDKHLKKHLKRKHSVYQCPHCEKCFHASKLSGHLRKHTKDKQYQCSHHEERFPHQSHLKTHAKEKPLYQCTHCEKRFSEQRYFTRHLRTHTKEKPFYQCTHCEKRFSEQGNFTYHLRTHAELFRCSFCDQRFATESCLRRHVQGQIRESPYHCSYSDQKFSFHTNVHFRPKV